MKVMRFNPPPPSSARHGGGTHGGSFHRPTPSNVLDGLCSQDLGEAGFNIYELKFNMYSSYILIQVISISMLKRYHF